MDYAQKNIPQKLNYDKAGGSYLPDEMCDALNHEIALTTLLAGTKGTNGKATPMPANYPVCEMDMPGGENYSVGARQEPFTNESYSWEYNSNGAHFLTRVNGNGSCQVVYYGCLELSPDPKHYIANWRAGMRVEKVCPNRDGHYLVWCDGTDFGIGYLDVEASIATNSFNTPFFEKCSPNPCDFVKMCVPEICGCIHAEFIPLPQSEVGMSNFMLDKGFKFMIKHVYYDGRESEWSDWSTLYYQETTACFAGSGGLSRCMKLRIPVGNAMVEKIKIAFSDNGGITWFLAETVEKYKKYNDLQQKWYEREFAELPNFSETDCAFDYIFCNDKERVQIAATDYARVRNPLPRAPQGFIRLADAFGFYNYIDGVCPVDKVQLDKLMITPDCTTGAQDCSSQFATVTVRAIIVALDPTNGEQALTEYISRLGGLKPDDPDDDSDIAYWGNGPGFLTGNNTPTGQQFNGKTRNFIVYIEGTDYWGEMKQWKSNAGFTDQKLIGVVAAGSDNRFTNQDHSFVSNGGYWYQEYKFRVLKGTRGFLRLASHNETAGTGGSQNTSTQVFAIISDITQYNSTHSPRSLFDRNRREIYFDTCNGDVDLKETFAVESTSNNTHASYSGYIKDKSGLPVEGAYLDVPNIITDHNGFYSFQTTAENLTINIKTELDCAHGFQTVQAMTLAGKLDTYTSHTETITSDVYNTNFYLQVEQKLLDCDGNGVPGIRVAVAGSKSRVTDAGGIAHLRLRNNTTRNRIIHTVAMNSNGCFTLDCNNQCNPCMPTNIENAPACYFGPPVFTIPDMRVNKKSLLSILNGLKNGGRYPFAALLQGDCGRESAAYLLTYLDIPKTQEKNKLNFCKFGLSLNGFVGPSWASCLKILRGANENPFELQWVVDKFERTGDGKIKITIQSLNDYNKKYFFQSNTVYQWAKGDRIEFISNGDGSILTTAANGVLNYLTISPFHDTLISGIKNADANYFNQLIIEDDNRLGAITEGAIIELQRPKQSTGETIFYEICVTIPLINGIPVVDNVNFSTFDTYVIPRTSGSFLGYFESKYPSDFWGQTTPGFGLDDTGKRHVKDSYETEKRFGRNISLSAVTQPNYFGDIIKKFGSPEDGDITAMGIYDEKIILAIGEHNNFMAQSADELVRVNRDGTITAAPADVIIGSAEPKVRGKFGCQYDSIGSVFFGDGYVRWVDKNKGVDVKHDFSEAKDISIGRTESFFRRKCQEMSNHNAKATDFLNHLRFVTGFNYATGAVPLTIKTLRQSGINNSLDPYDQPNVTLLYHPVADVYLTRASYTPEAYSSVILDDDGGCAFITYLHGIPYVHPKLATVFNEFYGVSVDWSFTSVINQFSEKSRTPLSFELQSAVKWYVPQVTTEKADFLSEIPPVRVVRDKDKWNGAFLKNSNSRGGIYRGDPASSYFIKVVFIRDNTIQDRYGTIDHDKRRAYSELGEVFFKFKINEQTGFTANM